MSETKEIEITNDLLIHINGIPFTLKKGSIVEGLESNFILAMEYENQPKASGNISKGD